MKRAKELEVIELMISLYCRKAHGTKKGELCPECRELLEYVKQRRAKCPWGDNKPFCANCPIHCYKPSMHERILKVMRYSGPRMMFYHPVIAMSHVHETLRQKRLMKKKDYKPPMPPSMCKREQTKTQDAHVEECRRQEETTRVDERE